MLRPIEAIDAPEESFQETLDDAYDAPETGLSPTRESRPRREPDDTILEHDSSSASDPMTPLGDVQYRDVRDERRRRGLPEREEERSFGGILGGGL